MQINAKLNASHLTRVPPPLAGALVNPRDVISGVTRVPPRNAAPRERCDRRSLRGRVKGAREDEAIARRASYKTAAPWREN